MSNDLFDTDNTGPVIDPNKDYMTELVGEGKKFKDAAALARGKMESDAFIAKLQNELSELRQEVVSRAKLEDIVAKLQEAPKQVEQPPLQEPKPQPAGLTDEDLRAFLNKELAEREAARRKEDNVSQTIQKLKESLGHNYVDALKAKAQELGVDTKWFNNLAAENPGVLLKLVGAEGTPAPKGNDLFAPPPQGHQTFKPSTTERTQSYYDKLKNEQPTVYWSRDTQVAMHKDAMRLGERFFS